VPPKRWRTRVAIAVAAPLAMLVLAEIAARVTLGSRFVFGAYAGPPQAICGEYDAELGWRNRAGVHVRIAGAGSTYEVRLNSRGHRGPERAPAKPPGVKRVVLLGDSTSWGWGVDDQDMFSRRVEAALPQVEVINLAVPGYGTDQELWALERDGLAFAPDLVLLGFVWNDVVGNKFPVMHGMQKPLFQRAESGEWSIANRPPPLPVAENELAERRLLRELGMYSAIAKLFEPRAPVAVRLNLDDPKVQAGIERYWRALLDPNESTHHALTRLVETCRAAHAELWAFHVPHLTERCFYEPGAPVPEHAEGEEFIGLGSRTLRDAGSQLGFEVFSIDKALLDVVSTGVSLDCGDEPLNARGNSIVADVIVARLRTWLARTKS
jgi:hypothetical protein